MKVGWLADSFELRGGAELTQAEFRAAAPAGVEVVELPARPARAARRLRRRLHPQLRHLPAPRRSARSRASRSLRYWHDLARDGGPGDPALIRWALEHATSVFTSPLHRDRFPHRVEGESHLIPPAIDLARFRAQGKQRPRGACWLGSAMHAGKGLLQAFEWAEENEPVDFWGVLPVEPPHSPRIVAKGPVPPEYVPDILGRYERFVFLPTTVEPFGRAVGRGVGRGLRADRQPQRRRAALDRAARTGSRPRPRTSGAWSASSRREDEAPDPQQRSLVAVGLRPAGGAVRAAARRSTPTWRSAPSTASRTRR